MYSTEQEVCIRSLQSESIWLICLRKPKFYQQEIKTEKVRGVAELLASQKCMVAQKVEVPKVQNDPVKKWISQPILDVELEDVEPEFRVMVQQVMANHVRKWMPLLLQAIHSELQVHHNTKSHSLPHELNTDTNRQQGSRSHSISTTGSLPIWWRESLFVLAPFLTWMRRTFLTYLTPWYKQCLYAITWEST